MAKPVKAALPVTFEAFVEQAQTFVAPITGEENPVDYCLNEAAAALESTREAYIMARVKKGPVSNIEGWAARTVALLYQAVANIGSMATGDPYELVAAIEAAKILGTSRQHISQLVKQGKLVVVLRKLRQANKGGRQSTYYYRHDINRLAADGVGKKR